MGDVLRLLRAHNLLVAAIGVVDSQECDLPEFVKPIDVFETMSHQSMPHQAA